MKKQTLVCFSMQAKHALKNSLAKVLIRTVDTDVMVLAFKALQLVPINSEIWVAFRSGNTSRYLSAHSFSNSLGRDNSLALSVFHVLTSVFVGHGNKSSWSVWNAMPELTGAFLSLSSSLVMVSDECFSTPERFVILLYD